MLEYFDDNSRVHGSEPVNLINDTYLEGNPAVGTLIDAPRREPTFCPRCRSVRATGIDEEWDTSFDQRCVCQVDHDVYSNGHSSVLLRHSIDGSDTPLLSPNETFGHLSINPLHDEEWDHCHSSIPLSTSSPAVRKLVGAMAMCLLFMIVELIGGAIAGSLAVMTDAAHLTSDFAGFVVSLTAIWLGKRPANKRLTFGYHRAEVLGALLSISIIWVMTAVLVCLAVQRIIHRDFHIDADSMMAIAGVGIFINIIMGLVLHGSCEGSSHGHSHGGHDRLLDPSASHAGHQHENINVRAAVIHVLGDLIQSIGVFVSAVIIKFYPSAELMDPICTMVFSVLVLCTTLPVVRDSARVLMEACPRSHDYAALAKALRKIKGVRTVHDLHIWSLTINKNSLSTHLTIDSNADAELVLKTATRVLRHKFGIHRSTLQVERYYADAMLHCTACQPLPD